MNGHHLLQEEETDRRNPSVNINGRPRLKQQNVTEGMVTRLIQIALERTRCCVLLLALLKLLVVFHLVLES